jgi:long-chain acyl-CoA synthetase
VVTATIAGVLRPALRDRPDAPAVVARSGTLSYAELDRAATAAASAMWYLGVRPGDRVAACLPNDLDSVSAFHGAQRIGAIWTGINEASPEREQRAVADLAAPALILAGLDLDQLRSLCGLHLARYKIPEAWAVVGELPVNAMGKIIRTGLPGLLEDARGAV